MNKIKKTLFLTFACIFALGISGCQEKKSATYLKVNVGEELFCIPKDYFEFPHVNDEDGGFLIGALYPEMSPMKEVTPESIGKANYFMNSINITAQKVYTLDKPAAWVDMFPRGYEVLKDKREYGLIPTRRLPRNHLHEIWFHPDARINDSYAEKFLCHEAVKEGDPEYRNSYCSYYFIKGNLSYKVTFNREHLKDWQAVNSKVSLLVSGFDCKNFEQQGG